MNQPVTPERITAYLEHLRAEERSPATLEKYSRELHIFMAWQKGSPLTHNSAIAYKAHLAQRYAAASVNAILAALNGYLRHYRYPFQIKPLKMQRRIFTPGERELTRAEYGRLLEAANRKHNERLNLVMQAICSTGCRVSELRYITVEALRAGHAEVTSKRKTRIIFLPQKLRTALLRYAKKRGIVSGPVFVTQSGKPLDRSNIWSAMKNLCAEAGVPGTKVFPHNLRHLFARTFYALEKDIVRLADILGHSSVNTTRIYTMESGQEHMRRLESLGLVT